MPDPGCRPPSPHAPDDGCDCRKPRPGLFLQAADRFGLDLKRSYVIGDMVSDILAAQAIGARPVLVLTGLGSRERSKLPAGAARSHQVVQDLQAAVRVVFNGQ